MVCIKAVLYDNPKDSAEGLQPHELAKCHLPLIAEKLSSKPVLDTHDPKKRIGRVVSAAVLRDADGNAQRLQALMEIDDEYEGMIDTHEYASLGHRALSMNGEIVALNPTDVGLVRAPGRSGTATWRTWDTQATNAALTSVWAACADSDVVKHPDVNDSTVVQVTDTHAGAPPTKIVREEMSDAKPTETATETQVEAAAAPVAAATEEPVAAAADVVQAAAVPTSLDDAKDQALAASRDLMAQQLEAVQTLAAQKAALEQRLVEAERARDEAASHAAAVQKNYEMAKDDIEGTGTRRPIVSKEVWTEGEKSSKSIIAANDLLRAAKDLKVEAAADMQATLEVAPKNVVSFMTNIVTAAAAAKQAMKPAEQMLAGTLTDIRAQSAALKEALSGLSAPAVTGVRARNAKDEDADMAPPSGKRRRGPAKEDDEDADAAPAATNVAAAAAPVVPHYTFEMGTTAYGSEVPVTNVPLSVALRALRQGV